MRITDLLKSDSIVLGAAPADKAAAINQLADLMAAGGNLSDKNSTKKTSSPAKHPARPDSATALRHRMPRVLV